MSGIVFFRTKQLDLVKRYYTDELGCELWLDQKDCAIMQHGNMLVGFCEKSGGSDGLITFFFEERSKVDEMYAKLKKAAEGKPAANKKYGIYQFFARDPEGRRLEFQCFDKPVNAYLTGEELLIQRRSVRKFARKAVPQGVVDDLIEVSRWTPTARNSQSFYFRVIRDKETISDLSYVRGQSSEPIRYSPVAVVVCGDPSLSSLYIQDACLGAFQFVLAAWYRGLGTCWIGNMDTKSVKKLLKIPKDHYVAAVTPLGYPVELPIVPPDRKEASWFVR